MLLRGYKRDPGCHRRGKSPNNRLNGVRDFIYLKLQQRATGGR